jgi:Ca-activated chloride channel family protein
MKKKQVRPLLFVGVLVAVTCAAMAYSSSHVGPIPTAGPGHGIVQLSAQLTQDKVLSGSDGAVGLTLTMRADDVLDPDHGDARPVDLVIVLDRSGSMGGKKIDDAKKAALNLLSGLSPQDRLALVSYSDGVRRHSNLLKVTATNRMVLTAAIQGVYAGGGTNLGAGLQDGIDVLLNSQREGRAGRLILISDGLANQGVTDPASLGRMASIAQEKAFGVSTVGVGSDFNEQLMTSIADRGAGQYYYLEDPQAFAAVFQREFHHARAVVAEALEVRVPLRDGLSVVDAAGYPIEVKNNEAVLYPGNLLSGQTRKLFLTLRVPTEKEAVFNIRGVRARYCYEGTTHTATLNRSFQIACLKDQEEVFASIDKSEWEAKVLHDEYNRLREDVAADIKAGNEEEAISRIKHYGDRQQAINSVVGSSEVADNVEKDLEDLRGVVKETFQGAPAEVAQKQKKNAKALQYEGYVGRRSGK